MRISTVRYETIEEFNVDSKAECDQLNVVHVARKIRTQNKQTPVTETSENFCQ